MYKVEGNYSVREWKKKNETKKIKNNHNSVFVWIAFDSCYNHEICVLVVMKPDSYIDV